MADQKDTEEVVYMSKFINDRLGSIVGTRANFGYIVYPMPCIGHFDDPAAARRDQAFTFSAAEEKKTWKTDGSQKKSYRKAEKKVRPAK